MQIPQRKVQRRTKTTPVCENASTSLNECSRRPLMTSAVMFFDSFVVDVVVLGASVTDLPEESTPLPSFNCRHDASIGIAMKQCRQSRVRYAFNVRHSIQPYLAATARILARNNLKLNDHHYQSSYFHSCFFSEKSHIFLFLFFPFGKWL